MIVVKYPFALVAAFIWVGFICSISFMEAWLKFRAPGVSIPIGLGIGRLVFDALNKVEWLMAIVILSNFLLAHEFMKGWMLFLFVVPFVLLIAQTFWLLPALDTRAELYIQGIEPAASNLHFYFVGFEVTKVACLSIFGRYLFEKILK